MLALFCCIFLFLPFGEVIIDLGSIMSILPMKGATKSNILLSPPLLIKIAILVIAVIEGFVLVAKKEKMRKINKILCFLRTVPCFAVTIFLIFMNFLSLMTYGSGLITIRTNMALYIFLIIGIISFINNLSIEKQMKETTDIHNI